VILSGWIAAQVAIIGPRSFLQPLLGAVGLALIGLGLPAKVRHQLVSWMMGTERPSTEVRAQSAGYETATGLPGPGDSSPPGPYGVDLYWLPLGAGGHSVRLNGVVYEALLAGLERRRACDLYHSALEIRAPSGRFVIEMAPVRAGEGAERDVVAGGAVGSRWAGRFRIFRYEIRRWREGYIPDAAEAVDSPRHVSSDPDLAQRVLDLVPSVPTPVWGRDELATGDMWNSNSLTSWLLLRSGLDTESICPPAGGRAPGWQAGLVVASRQTQAQLSPLSRGL